MRGMEVIVPIVVTILVIGLFAVLPIWAIVHFRLSGTGGRDSGTRGIGSALFELDRLLSRPSIEHVVKAEDDDKLHEDAKAGD